MPAHELLFTKRRAFLKKNFHLLKQTSLCSFLEFISQNIIVVSNVSVQDSDPHRFWVARSGSRRAKITLKSFEVLDILF